MKRNPVRSLDGNVPSAGNPGHEALGVLLLSHDAGERKTTQEILGRAGYEVIVASNLSEARAQLDRIPMLHAAVVDATLDDGSCLALVGTLLERKPLCRAVVLTHAPTPAHVCSTARAGAHAYLRKPSTVPDLLDAVARTVQSTLEWRDALQPPSASSRATASDDSPTPMGFDVQRAVARLRYIANLSPAETMTAWRLLWGDSNKRMAELMGCTERTVKFHVAEVLARTGARSRAGLLRVLLEDAGVRDPWDSRGLLSDDD